MWVAVGFCWNVQITLEPPKSDLFNQRIRDSLKKKDITIGISEARNPKLFLLIVVVR